MALTESKMRKGHPPPGRKIKKKKKGSGTSSALNTLRKVTLFIIIFVISFHLPSLLPVFKQKRETIKEISQVLKQSTDLAEVTQEELAEVIYEEAVRNNQDPKFILALISIESSFYNWSVSNRGAKGLMQIMPYVGKSLAQELGIEWSGDQTLFNPYLNIKMGSYYLARLLREFDDPRIALAAYNCGPTYIKSLRERNGVIPLEYYNKIQIAYQKL